MYSIDLPFAMSFKPTFSIALSKARPMRNSRERSASPLALSPPSKDMLLLRTVDTLRVSKGLVLLGFVPLDDQSITECQCRAAVCCPVFFQPSLHRSACMGSLRLIAVVHRPSQGRLNMSHHLFLERVFVVELACGLCLWSILFRSRYQLLNISTHMLFPSVDIVVSQCLRYGSEASYGNSRFSLRLWNARLNALDLLRPKASHRSLVLWSGDARRADRLLELGDGCRSTWLPLSLFCRHLD